MKIQMIIKQHVLLVFLFILGEVSTILKYSDGGTIDLIQMNQTAFSVEILIKKGSWVGIGYGNSMIKCDMNAINAYSNGTFDVLDLYSFKHTTPSKDISIGGNSDLREITKTDEGSFIRINYSRLLNTGDQYDIELFPNKTIPFIVAWNDGQIEKSYHGLNYYKTNVTITTNGGGEGEVTSADIFWYVHGIGMFVAWNLFVLTGYISARFLKHYPWWNILHFLGGTVPALFSVGIIIAAIIKNKDKTDPPLTNSIHVIFGLTFFGILIVQILLGYISFFGIYKSKRVNSDRLIKFKNLHKFIGMFLFFVSHLSQITGFLILFPNYFGLPVALCGFSLSLVIILEIIHYKTNKNKVDLVSQTFQEEDNSSNVVYSLKQVQDAKSRIKFVLYENFLLDVTQYSEVHPGGKNLIKDNLYSDISRYITGNQAYSSKISAYDHKAQTCIYAIKSLTFAKFTDDHQIVLLNNKTSYLNHDMIFEFKTEIAENTCQMVYSNTAFEFPIFLPGVNWIGRHFAVSSTELNKTRYYSLCLCLNKNIQEKINILFNNLRSLENNQSINSATIKEKEMYSNNISLYIKSYNYSKALSQYLHNVRPATSSKINIRGPIGIGLGLGAGQKLSGTCILVAGGTGVLPYLDFAFYVIRYMVDRVSQESFKEYKNKIDERETFSDIQDDFKLILFASYSSRNSAFMHDVLQMANSLDKKYNLNKFDYYMRSSSDEKWEKSFYQAATENVSKQANQLHLCGPVGFMEFMRNNFLETGKIGVDQMHYT